MAHESPAVLTEVTGPAAIIRFNRPRERNPLSRSTLSELQAALRLILPRPDLRFIIFTGTADIFLSGAHIRELAELSHSGALEFSNLGQELFQTISEARQTTIAAINGYCMGGGLDLALACDIRIASPDAVFAHPGARLGIITGWGGTQRLTRLIGKAASLEMLLTAGRVSSAEALRLGMISRVSGQPLESAIALAATSLQAPNP